MFVWGASFKLWSRPVYRCVKVTENQRVHISQRAKTQYIIRLWEDLCLITQQIFIFKLSLKLIFTNIRFLNKKNKTQYLFIYFTSLQIQKNILDSGLVF